VSIPAPILARVHRHIEKYGDESETAQYVFTSVKGRPLLNRYFAPYWRRARDQVGLDGVRFHDLRHLAGTEAASAGASLREVMARMGHASSDASLRYLKASERRDREIGEALTLRIEASMSDAADA
jgi:integrase